MLLSIINNVLDFSKIENGKETLNLDKVNIKTVVNKIGNAFAYRLMMKNLLLAIRIDDNVPKTLVTDKIKIRQILNNTL
jgi:signal transduction histidine kinase